MNEIINILKNNWELIVSVLLFILSFILQLIKKKPVQDILSDIYHACVSAINETEKSNVIGSYQKQLFAIEIVNKYLQTKYPDIDVKRYIGLIVATIEDILSTPQKKGGNVDGETKKNG